MSGKRRPFAAHTVMLFSCGVCLFGAVAYLFAAKRNAATGGLFLLGVALSLFAAGAVTARSYDRRLTYWYAKYALDEVSRVRYKSINGKPVGGKWVTNAAEARRAEFCLWLPGKTVGQTIEVDRDETPKLFKKLADAVKNDVRRIDHTQIIAVNNTRITTTVTRPSTGSAILGGLAFGAPGFLLGAMQGSTQSTTRNGKDVYTFLITLKNGRRLTDKVTEGSRDFIIMLYFLKRD